MGTIVSTIGTYTPDNLIAGDYPLKTIAITIASGESIVRGEVLGKVTATGKYLASLAGASDGSETPDVIATDIVDASSADTVSTGYIKGEFNENELTLGTGHTIASITAGLKDKGIILRDSIAN